MYSFDGTSPTLTMKKKKKQKIWTIATERYKGWRSALSATYKAYNNYAERIRNIPEEVHLLEWHYLLLYFGSEKFKVTCSKFNLVEHVLSTKMMHY